MKHEHEEHEEKHEHTEPLEVEGVLNLSKEI